MLCVTVLNACYEKCFDEAHLLVSKCLVFCAQHVLNNRLHCFACEFGSAHTADACDFDFFF